MRNKKYDTKIALLNATLVIIATLVTGCQKELFPIYGITLGQTDEDQLKSIGKADDGLYVVHGQDFWVKDGMFNRMYLVSDQQLPLKWRNMGLDWFLSYDQWGDLLNDLGFTISVEKAPSVEMYDEHESFSAKIKALKKNKVPVELILDFKYSEETTTSAEGTLYSIKIRIP